MAAGGVLGPAITPAPSNVVIVDPRTNIPGTLVFVKQGNLWTQTGNKAIQITTSGAGSMPSWSPDGQWIYYIESVHEMGYFPADGNGPNRYAMDYPVLTRVHPDGTGADTPQRSLSTGPVHLVLLDPPAARSPQMGGRS